MEHDDYDGALALMNGPGPMPLLMSRAEARYSDKIPKAPSDQHKERAFQMFLQKCVALQEGIAQQKYLAMYGIVSEHTEDLGVVIRLP